MANIGAVITSIRNIMRQDRGISGDAQRLEQLGWMLFLKIMDDKDQELEIIKDDYQSVNSPRDVSRRRRLIRLHSALPTGRASIW